MLYLYFIKIKNRTQFYADIADLKRILFRQVGMIKT